MALTLLTTATNKAEQYVAEMIGSDNDTDALNAAWRVTHFAVTANGHDTGTGLALTPDPSLECTDPLWCGGYTFLSGLYYKAITSYAYLTVKCPTFTCTIDPNECVGNISQILLLGSLVGPAHPASPPPHFVAGVGNMNVQTKGALDTWTFTLGMYMGV